MENQVQETQPETQQETQIDDSEKKIIEEILSKHRDPETGKIKVNPRRKTERKTTPQQLEHLKKIREKALEARRQNAARRREEKKIEKASVIKQKVDEGVEEKVSKSYKDKLDKMDELASKFESLLNSKQQSEETKPKRKPPIKRNKKIEVENLPEKVYTPVFDL